MKAVHQESPEAQEVVVMEKDDSGVRFGPGNIVLDPQPSQDPRDPLNWSYSLKVFVLVQVSLLAALGTLNTAIVNPALVPLADEFHLSSSKIASYQTTVAIALNGIGPFIYVPLANAYGRRPIYLFSGLLGFASALGAARSKTWGQLIVARVFNGLFPAAFSLAPATVADLFFLHERGRATGIFTVLLSTGAHIAPLIGGPVGQFLGWQWCFYIAAILDGAFFVLNLFFLPETIYDREAGPLPKGKLGNYGFVFPHPSRKLRARQFVIPVIKMFKYPSVVGPAFYYAVQYGLASILPALTVAPIFSVQFGWSPLVIGLTYGGVLTVGALLGEFAGGLVVDYIVKREMNRNDVEFKPEDRLKAIWTGEFLVPAGLLIYGFTLQYHTNFMGPLLGMGISVFGIQVVSTVCYTYSIDCYRDQSAQVAQLFNFVRQTTSFTYAFYAIPLGTKIGYQFAFLIYALVGSGVCFIPIVFCMVYGQRTRDWLGQPTFTDHR